MIHHLARAFFIRNTAASGAGKPPSDSNQPASAPVVRPVKARPITPWTTPVRPSSNNSSIAPMRAIHAPANSARRVRISTDPADARRTVITGRFAEVCAALDKLVLEQEAIA